MKRVVITGASGFVGANLARRCLRDGHNVHLLARPGRPSWRIDQISSEVRMHAVSLHNRDAVKAAIASIKPDWVFHLAAYGAYPTQNCPHEMATTNVGGCMAMLGACTDVGVEAFVQTGSSSEYGYKDHPASERELLQPNSAYAVTKAAATHYCQYVAAKFNINAITVRLYSIYGPYEEPSRFIPTLIVHGLQGCFPPLVSPTIARDFVYIEECVEAIMRVAAAPGLPRGAVYNVCSGTQTTLSSAVAAARKLFGITDEPVWSTMAPRSWDTDKWVGSPELMESEVGWRSKVDFEIGLARTVEWFRAHPHMFDFYRSQVLDQGPQT
jgi:UDP-glucose 4-epimerase